MFFLPSFGRRFGAVRCLQILTLRLVAGHFRLNRLLATRRLRIFARIGGNAIPTEVDNQGNNSHRAQYTDRNRSVGACLADIVLVIVAERRGLFRGRCHRACKFAGPEGGKREKVDSLSLSLHDCGTFHAC